MKILLFSLVFLLSLNNLSIANDKTEFLNKITEKISNYFSNIIEKDGLTETIIDDILNEKYCKLNKTNVIINLWRVLTKSSLSSFSYDCEKVDLKKLHDYEGKELMFLIRATIKIDDLINTSKKYQTKKKFKLN